MNSLLYSDSIDTIEAIPLVEDVRKTEITDFINRLDCSNIFPPKFTASELMVKTLNREGLPKRPMNRFFCLRHVVYLEVLHQGLIDLVKDGVFLTQVAGKMWNETT